MAHHDRRTFLRAIGLGTTGVLASNYAADAVAAATTITIEGAATTSGTPATSSTTTTRRSTATST
ncbi:hypothetical protein ACFQL4_17950 [Halosimplex aquaticum]